MISINNLFKELLYCCTVNNTIDCSLHKLAYLCHIWQRQTKSDATPATKKVPYYVELGMVKTTQKRKAIWQFPSLIPVKDAFKIHNFTCNTAWSHSYAYKGDFQCPLSEPLAVDRVGACKMILKWAVCRSLKQFHHSPKFSETNGRPAAAHLCLLFPKGISKDVKVFIVICYSIDLLHYFAFSSIYFAFAKLFVSTFLFYVYKKLLKRWLN